MCFKESASVNPTDSNAECGTGANLNVQSVEAQIDPKEVEAQTDPKESSGSKKRKEIDSRSKA